MSLSKEYMQVHCPNIPGKKPEWLLFRETALRWISSMKNKGHKETDLIKLATDRYIECIKNKEFKRFRFYAHCLVMLGVVEYQTDLDNYIIKYRKENNV